MFRAAKVRLASWSNRENGEEEVVRARQQEFGRKYYEWLLQQYVSGEKQGSECCVIAYYHTMSGGVGLEKLSMDPKTASKHGNRHAKFVFGRDWKDPSFFYAKTYVYDKKTSRRSEIKMPVLLPTLTLIKSSERVCDHVQEDGDFGDSMWHEAYNHHPVVKRGRCRNMNDEDILPIALYWDGVQFTKTESFTAFYFRHLRLQLQYLSFLVRDALSWCQNNMFELIQVHN